MKKIFEIVIGFLKPKLIAIKKWTISAIRLISKILVKIVVITSLLSFAVVPFLHNCINHDLAQWIWYPACVLSILESIIANARNKRQTFKKPLFEFLGKWGEFVIYPIIVSVFVINYYEIDYAWMWVIFGMIALCVPMFFFLLLSFHIKNNNLSEDAKQKSSQNIVKSILLYWFIDLFYMSIFNDWLISTFVFGILAIVIIFFNLVNAFLNGAKILRFFIVLEMIIALIMSGYLIYIIPNESLQVIVLQIVTALYGGVLTLVGVAWTIKDTNDKRQEDLQRIESERKEEERKKHIPYIRIAKKEDVTVYGTISKIQSIDFEHAEDRKKLVDNCFVSIYRIIMLLKNISLNNIVLRGVYIDGEYYDLETAVLVEKGAVCKIEIGDKSKMYFVDEIKTIQLKISDIFDNTYKVEVIIRFEDTRESIEVLADGKTFYGNTKHYFIDGCKLPELIKEEEKHE